ncbi:MAG: M23 family metallopeptidase [Acidobacteriota bacterium]|nr:M23 family metallopeptidase [Acidobacteriota bacterium]
MKQDYFIVVLAHSLHGRLQRVHIPHKAVFALLALACIGAVSLVGFISSYARMAWKVANYNTLRNETDNLRARYQRLQKTVNQTNAQLASLQMLAQEVTVAYGIKQKIEGPSDIIAEGRLTPTMSETLENYNYLRASKLSRLEPSYGQRWQTNIMPSIWPVDGRLMGGFGSRSDPFSGEGAYHTGVDISAPTGTQIRATADGRVQFAGFYNGYGRLVIIDHGNNYQTYYAHLSSANVTEGQEIRRGQTVGAVGTTGRSTGPHLHYEVRIGSSPVNPYRFLQKTVAVQQTPRSTDLF